MTGTDSFAVVTADVRTFAARLDALAVLSAPGGEAQTYTKAHLQLEWADTAVLYGLARDALNGACDRILTMLSDQGRALSASAGELRATADAYDETDDAVDAALDRIHSAFRQRLPRSALPTPVCLPGAGEALVAPETAPPTDYVGDILSVDWLSPTGAVRQVLDWLFDWDPLAEVHKAFTGDWNRLYACGSATDHLRDFLGRTGSEVMNETSTCLVTWQGEAAAVAARYFSEIDATCQANAEVLFPFAEQCRATSHTMEAAADTLGDLLGSIMDISIAAAIAYGLGAAFSWTGVGGVVGAILGTGLAARALWLVGQAWSVIQEAYGYIDYLVVAANALGSIGAGDLTFRLPAAYDNGRVR